MTNPTISAEERARSVEFCGRNIIAQVIRQAEQAAYERAMQDDAVYKAVVGWREHDWPEGFDRRTAELIADHVREIRALAQEPAEVA